MSSQKKIEIHQSSFLSLKAELLRKKQEVHDAKLSNIPFKADPIRKGKVKTKLDRANDGVNERNLKDAEDIEDETNALKKSQKALEVKSTLYDVLLQNPDIAVSSSNILVDFAKKEKETDKKETAVDEPEEKSFEYDLDDDEEWIDFVDCLGRTKRCHKDDLESMKTSDEKLRLSLFGRSEARARNESDPRKEVKVEEVKEETGQPELCSDDMRRKMLREKWEEEEKKLADLRDIHYQHVLFDEARSHGVGYYHFSTDEAVRARQLKDLENMRKVTVEQQALAKEVARRKKKQMQDRLRAARRRKRERLGLPPEEEEEEGEETDEVGEEPAKPEELKREEQKSSETRPWDIGKIIGPKFYTQEEWIELKRAERPKEFAPPQSFESARLKKKRKPEERCLSEAYLEDMTSKPGNRRERNKQEQEITPKRERGMGAEIPPPPTFELYGPSSTRTTQSVITPDIEKSIEEGLNIIRKQVEEKQMRKSKYPLNIF